MYYVDNKPFKSLRVAKWVAFDNNNADIYKSVGNKLVKAYVYSPMNEKYNKIIK